MNTAAPRTRLTLASLQWFVAAGVASFAVLQRFAAGASWPTWAALLAIAGAALGASPVRFQGKAARRLEALLGAVGLVGLGLGLRLVLRLVEGGPPPATTIWIAPWVAVALLLLLDVVSLPRWSRLVRVEWLKLRRNRLFLVGLVSTAALTLLAAFTHEKLPNASGWDLAASSLGTGWWGAEVFVLVLGATALSGEAGGGTLKMILPHAYRRSDWIFAKATIVLVAAVAFTLVVAVAGIGHAAFTDGLGDVTRELEPDFMSEPGEIEYETFRERDVMRGHLMATLIGGFAALVATGMLGLFLSSVFDGVIPSLCVGFLLFAGLKFADVLLRIPRDALQGIYSWYPEQLRDLTSKLGRAINERWDEALPPAGLWMALITGAAMLVLAARAFSKRDLQS